MLRYTFGRTRRAIFPLNDEIVKYIIYALPPTVFGISTAVTDYYSDYIFKNHLWHRMGYIYIFYDSAGMRMSLYTCAADGT